MLNWIMVLLNNYVLSCALSINADGQTIALINRAADKNKIQRSLLHAIVRQESNYKHKAINSDAPVKSYGLAQLTINTAKDRCGLNPDQVMDPVSNINCAAKYLAWQIKRYKGDEYKAISAYNSGTFTRKNIEYTLSVLSHQTLCKTP